MRALAGLFALALAGSPVAAQRSGHVTVTPYVEIGQIVAADLDDGDVVTYSQVAAGIDAAASTRRVVGQLSYRYERQIAWSDKAGDADVHTALARLSAAVAPGLTIEAGGIATRARADIGGGAPGLFTGRQDNVSQIYSVFAGPSYSGHVGDVAVGASYLAGYTKAETPDRLVLAPGAGRRDHYDDSFGQVAGVTAGIAPGVVLPVGLTATAGWSREDAGQLDQRFQDWFVRGDVLAPVSGHLALTAGAGYQKIETSKRAPLRDAAGVPVLDEHGRFATDPASARRVAYRTDGLYYDAGVVWRPNRRTSAEAHVGKRYGSLSVTGTLTYQASRDVGAAAQVYDVVTTFGQQLRGGLKGLPTSFVAARDGVTQRYSGCVFGTSGAAPGGCLNDVFQSVETATYRARGVDAILSATRGRSVLGIGAGYANRRLHAPDAPAGITVDGAEDQSWYAQTFYRRSLSPVSAIDANMFVNYYEPGFTDGIWSYGATASYARSFGRVTTSASLGLYSFDLPDSDAEWSAQALLAARYSF